MAITLTINGVDKTSLLKDGSFEVEKTGATERLTIDILVKSDNTASAYRPVVGDVVRMLHNADLLGGGPVVRVEDKRLGGNTGTVTTLTVRDWLYLAEQIIIEDRYFPPQDAYILFDDLVTTYLADKGVINLTPTSGGPVVPELFVKGETLLSVFLQIQEQTGYPYRINADKECALVEPGTLPGPFTLTPANVLDGLTWTQDELIQANRLSLTTGTPEAGAGPITFFETHIADGTMHAFPVNVIPNRTLLGRIDNDPAGYTAGTTSIALKDLTPGMVILANNSLTQEGDAATLCVVQSDVTVDEDGKATVTISPGLPKNADDNDPVTFSNETGITLLVNDVPTDLFGSNWVWDRLQQAVVNPVTAPTAGDDITIQSRVTFPVVVRVWETASVAVQDSQGNFDYAVIVDGKIDGQTHTDLPQAAAYARDVLTHRLTPPKIVRCTTMSGHWYPYLTATVTWAARLLSGTFLVDAVRIRHDGIDPDVTDDDLPIELEMVEGDNLRHSWVDYYRGQNPARGIQWGGIPSDAKVSQAAIEVMMFSQNALVSQATVETMLLPDTVARLSQASIEIMLNAPSITALPTTGLTAHFDASVAGDLFTTYVSGGPHTGGSPSDAAEIEVWADATGAARIFKKSGASATPNRRSSTPLLPLACLDFTGGERLILTNHSGTNQALSTVITDTAWTLLVSFYAETITDSAGQSYNNHAIIADTSGYWGVYLRVDGGVKKVSAFVWDGTEKNVTLACTDSAAHVVMVRLESGTLYASLDGGSESSLSVTNVDNVTGNVGVGVAYGSGSGLDGRIGELAIYNAALTGSDLTDAIAHFTDKWL